MLYKIKCNPMHPLYGALPVSYVPVRVTCGVLDPHRYTVLVLLLAAGPRNTAGLLFPPLYLCLMLLVTEFDGVGLSGFKSRANVSLSA